MLIAGAQRLTLLNLAKRKVMVFRKAAVHSHTDRLDLKTNWNSATAVTQMLREKFPDAGMQLYCQISVTDTEMVAALVL